LVSSFREPLANFDWGWRRKTPRKLNCSRPNTSISPRKTPKPINVLRAWKIPGSTLHSSHYYLSKPSATTSIIKVQIRRRIISGPRRRYMTKFVPRRNSHGSISLHSAHRFENSNRALANFRAWTFVRSIGQAGEITPSSPQNIQSFFSYRWGTIWTVEFLASFITKFSLVGGRAENLFIFNSGGYWQTFLSMKKTKAIFE